MAKPSLCLKLQSLIYALALAIPVLFLLGKSNLASSSSNQFLIEVTLDGVSGQNGDFSEGQFGQAPSVNIPQSCFNDCNNADYAMFVGLHKSLLKHFGFSVDAQFIKAGQIPKVPRCGRQAVFEIDDYSRVQRAYCI